MKMKNYYLQWKEYRKTLLELSRMSDYELRDIGLVRSEIENTAKSAFTINYLK